MTDDVDSMVASAGAEPPEIAQSEIEDTVLAYRDLRDQLATKRHEWEAFEDQCKESMEKMAMRLREIADRLGLQALPTKYGTAYKQIKEHYRVANWDEVRAYIERTGNWQMLEKRVAKLATKEIHQTTGEIPPGIEYSSEVEMVIRKS